MRMTLNRKNSTYVICKMCGHMKESWQSVSVSMLMRLGVCVLSIGGELVIASGWLSGEEAMLWSRSSQLLMKTASQPSVKSKWHSPSDSDHVSSQVLRLATTGPWHRLWPLSRTSHIKLPYPAFAEQSCAASMVSVMQTFTLNGSNPQILKHEYLSDL